MPNANMSVISRVMDPPPEKVDVARPCSIGRLSLVCHPFSVEPVAESAKRKQVSWTFWVGLDFLAQIRHLVVDNAIGHVRIGPPDLVEQLRTGEETSLAPDECGEKLVLERRQLDALATAA
jgi:hypothetical protein